MHGLAGFIIIGFCIGIALAGIVTFVMDLQKSRRAERRRKALLSRIQPK